MENAEEKNLTPTKGAFENLLRESGKQIRDRRAQNLSEDAKMAYKTRVENLGYDVRRLEREQEEMITIEKQRYEELLRIEQAIFEVRKSVNILQ